MPRTDETGVPGDPFLVRGKPPLFPMILEVGSVILKKESSSLWIKKEPS
jgi:hypothetical protein